MVNQDEYRDVSNLADFISNGVLKSNLAMEDSLMSKDASSEKATISRSEISETSCTQQLPRTTHGVSDTIVSLDLNTQTRSASSCSHFLNRDIPSSIEECIFELFLDCRLPVESAIACIDSLKIPVLESPKFVPLPPQPSQESPVTSHDPTEIVMREM
jgi:hypothetical protein